MTPGRTRLKSWRLDFWLAVGLTALAMAYLSYALPRLLPGDFVTSLYASSEVTLSPAQEEKVRAYYTQGGGFTGYLKKLATLDWGYSYAFLTPVSELIGQALPWSLLLLGLAHLLSLGLGFMAGVEAAWRRGHGLEKTLVAASTVLQGVPEISTGVILLAVFALKLQWLPAAGAETAYAQLALGERLLDAARHLALPLLTLLLAYLPGNFLLTRNSMVLVIGQPFITAARGKGLPPARIRYAHAARNALLPLITRFGLRLAFMITGALVVETIFSYPGLGTLLFNAIQMRDLPLVTGIVLISSLLVLLVNFSLDFVYRLLDPRIGHAR